MVDLEELEKELLTFHRDSDYILLQAAWEYLTLMKKKDNIVVYELQCAEPDVDRQYEKYNFSVEEILRYHDPEDLWQTRSY